jgi:hypothetical protein
MGLILLTLLGAANIWFGVEGIQNGTVMGPINMVIGVACIASAIALAVIRDE